MHDLESAFLDAITEGMSTRTLTTCSRWSAKRRIMGGDFPGNYGWKYHPWVQEILDSTTPFNYAMKGAQLGVTEVAINRALYVLDRQHRDVLYVLPTALNAGDFSKARFSAALQMSPYIKSMFTATDTVNLKQAGANTLYIRGSRGDSNLKSIPVSTLILDEVDEMEQKQIGLALERLSGQKVKNVLGISTPTIPDYGIHKLYLRSTQEHFVFQCPHCGRWTELVWPDCIEIIGLTAGDPDCAKSFLKCKECKGRLEHESKPDWLGTAKWQSMAPNANPEIRGFHVSQMYSFTVTPGELVVAYHCGRGDEFANKEFHNSKLGLPFIGDGAQITDAMIDNCLAEYTINDLRPLVGGRKLMTMGADQGKTGHISVVEWTLDGPPGKDINAVAQAKLVWFGKFGEEDWGYLDELMREWQILACVVDADPNINEARRFARRFYGFVWLTRYRRGTTAKEMSIDDADDGAPIAQVDRTNWLSCCLGRFKVKPPRIQLPRDLSLDYREHIKSLVRTYKKDESGNPKAVYVSTGADHYAHSLTYSEMGLPLAAAITSGESINKFM
jgi:hypothetical protein